MELFHIYSVIFFQLLLLSFCLVFEFFSINCNALVQCLQTESSMLLQLKRGFTSGMIDPSIVNLTSLRALDFANNQFHGDLEFEFIKDLKNLIALDLSNSNRALKNRRYMVILGILFGVGFGGLMAIVVVLDVMSWDRSIRRSRRPIDG
ncbi:hypothetical protein M5K25_000867 [Dendrobium thyrsiflorum]|uniref:Uncharacterized protein n=1 Tax=Dendrobium thyrsiflorum TaxID=117978 RepID=A0ABD0W9U2_DENTH